MSGERSTARWILIGGALATLGAAALVLRRRQRGESFGYTRPSGHKVLKEEAAAWGVPSIVGWERALIRTVRPQEGRPTRPMRMNWLKYGRLVRRLLWERSEFDTAGLDLRLLSAGVDHVRPTEWIDPHSSRSLYSFLDFWHATQPRPDIVGSYYNADPDHAVLMWRMMGYKVPEQRDVVQLLRGTVKDWRCLTNRRLIGSLTGGRRIPLKKLLRLSELICDIRLLVSDRRRLIKAPPEVRWIVNRALSEHRKRHRIAGRGDERALRIFSVVTRDRIVIDWNKVAEELRSPDFESRYLPPKAAWRKYHRYVPRNEELLQMPAAEIRRFDTKSYLAAYRAMQTAFPYRSPDLLQSLALRLANTFGQNWKRVIAKELEDPGSFGFDSLESIHDKTYWLPKYPAPEFGKMLLKHGVNLGDPPEEFRIIANNWLRVSELARQGETRIEKLLVHALGGELGKVQNKELAAEFVRWGYSPDQYAEIERRWLERKPPKRWAIPPIEVQLEGYMIKRLDRDDPRALFLGEHTHCCQSIGGAAESCVWYGVESPNSGFVVVTDEDGQIVAQSWVWRKGDVLVFDNVEGMTEGREEKIARLYHEAAKAALRLDSTLRAVHVGGRYSKIDVSRWPAASDPVPPPHNCYSDAEGQQHVIATVETLGEDMPAAKRNPVVEKIRRIERIAYPPFMRMMQHAYTLKDIADYAEVPVSDLRILGNDQWYAIIGLHDRGTVAELVDVAKEPNAPPIDWKAIFDAIRSFGAKRVVLDAREETLYPILKDKAEELGYRIAEDEPWDWNEETMHRMELELLPEGQ